MSYNTILVKLVDKNKSVYDFISRYLKVIPFDDYINNKNLYQIGILKNNDLIGIRVFKMIDHKIHLNYSVVIEHERNKGINKEMFKAIEEIAIKNNITIITSNVRKSNTYSLKSLLSSGFSVNEKSKLFYPDGEEKIALFKKLN
jgi:ribosomal protein S18 acetylase RimI-like enzyme